MGTPLEVPETAGMRRIPYRPAFERQRELVSARLAGEVPDLVWYLEHPPVISFNPGRGDGHLRVAAERLDELGVALESTDRGGDVTYHGPGQLVGYPIVDLDDRALDGGPERDGGSGLDGGAAGSGADLHLYLRSLEEALIQTLAVWGLEGFRSKGRTGVWLGGPRGPAKIAAIGVRARRWVTSHGFALNISCDLSPFRDLIVPCGIANAGVTSMDEALMEALMETPGGRSPGIDEVVPVLHERLESVLNRRLAVTFDGLEWSRSRSSPLLASDREMPERNA